MKSPTGRLRRVGPVWRPTGRVVCAAISATVDAVRRRTISLGTQPGYLEAAPRDDARAYLTDPGEGWRVVPLLVAARALVAASERELRRAG